MRHQRIRGESEMANALSWEEIENAVRSAAKHLRMEPVLFSTDANERSISHRFAVHLEPLFPGWNVDCEYNRVGLENNPKRLEVEKNEVPVDNLDGSRVFPDIIIHQRGINTEDANLLVIEVKKANNADSTNDPAKLTAFTGKESKVHYQYGLFVQFTENGDIKKMERYQDGRKVDDP
jgi:hypothetical protein